MAGNNVTQFVKYAQTLVKTEQELTPLLKAAAQQTTALENVARDYGNKGYLDSYTKEDVDALRAFISSIEDDPDLKNQLSDRKGLSTAFSEAYHMLNSITEKQENLIEDGFWEGMINLETLKKIPIEVATIRLDTLRFRAQSFHVLKKRIWDIGEKKFSLLVELATDPSFVESLGSEIQNPALNLASGLMRDHDCLKYVTEEQVLKFKKFPERAFNGNMTCTMAFIYKFRKEMRPVIGKDYSWCNQIEDEEKREALRAQENAEQSSSTGAEVTAPDPKKKGSLGRCISNFFHGL